MNTRDQKYETLQIGPSISMPLVPRCLRNSKSSSIRAGDQGTDRWKGGPSLGRGVYTLQQLRGTWVAVQKGHRKSLLEIQKFRRQFLCTNLTQHGTSRGCEFFVVIGTHRGSSQEKGFHSFQISNGRVVSPSSNPFFSIKIAEKTSWNLSNTYAWRRSLL